MFEKIIRFSLNNKAIVAFLTLVLIGFGIYSMQRIPVDAVPDITNNQVQVVTVAPSLAPQEVEKFITYPLEISFANITNVQEIRSVSRYGLSVVTVVFDERVPILDARQLINEQIQSASSEIPRGLGTPEMLPITTGLGEVFQYTLELEPGYEQKYDITELRTIQDWIVKRQLSGIPGIVEISSFGGKLKQYEISVDPGQLRQFDVSLSELYEAIDRNNENTGGSYIEKGPNAYYIRAEGIIESTVDLEHIVVKRMQGQPVLVKDLAEVKFGAAPRFGAMTKNGKGEAVGGITLMLKGANSSAVINEVKDRIEQVQQTLPEGVYIEPYLDRAELVKSTTNTLATNLVEGALIVIFVLVLLLGNMRSGLIVASVIPLSLLFAFIMMHIFGVSANLMSLGAVDFGIVIDGAVIIVESIIYQLYRKYNLTDLSQEKMDKVVAESTISIYRSAAFGVFIILIVFIPILTLTGIEGKTFRPMAQTFIFAILGAFFLSLTYVPVVASLFLKKKIRAKRNFSDRLIDFLKWSYRPVLEFALRFKFLILTVTLIVFIISLVSFRYLGGEFIPTLGEGDLAMQMTVPPGSSLTQSIKTATKAEKILLERFPEVEQVISKIGTAEVPTDPMAIEDADIMIILKEKEEWESAETREELVDKMKASLSVIPSASFDFTQPIQLRFNELMTGVKTDIGVKIFGEDLNELYAQANHAARLIDDIPGASDIMVEQVAGLPQAVITYNRKLIAQYGVQIEDLNNVVETAYSGKIAGVVF
ncbi:MAG: CusA/CzcA family heavy metal efflux RND transporter, partial [Bacteroidales bacterium]